MAQRILAFESDPSFSELLEEGFAGRGVALDIVADGSAGLERAAEERPDLILLSIELPSMNGFLVCKKLKKNAELKDVPLIILSSDANAEEIFEQHRKLRTRAEDYLRKPIAFDELLERVRAYVAVPEPRADGPYPARAADATEEHRGVVDEEIEAFADDAFDALLIEEGESSDAPPAAEASAGEDASETMAGMPAPVEAEEIIALTSVPPDASAESLAPAAPPEDSGMGTADADAYRSELAAAQQRARNLEAQLEGARAATAVAEEARARAEQERDAATGAAGEATGWRERAEAFEAKIGELEAEVAKA